MTSYIGYNNFFREGTVTASSEQGNLYKENAYDGFTYDWWAPNSGSPETLTVDMGAGFEADYWAMGFANSLNNNNANVAVEYSDFSDFSVMFSFDFRDWSGASDDMYMAVVSPKTARYWRFRIWGNAPSPIAVVAIGKVLALPREVPLGFVSPLNARDTTVLNNRSNVGQFIGRTVIRESRKFTIRQRLATQLWIDSNWHDLVEAIEVNPFVYMWDQENRPLESIFAWSDGKIKQPTYNKNNLLDFSIPCRGLIK